MSDRIAASLRLLFEDQRIVFWYDADRDMRVEFEAVDLPGVTKLEIANNEFGLKLRILRREAEGRFLLFKDGPEPPMTENWLLDVQLAHGEFRTDQRPGPLKTLRGAGHRQQRIGRSGRQQQERKGKREGGKGQGRSPVVGRADHTASARRRLDSGQVMAGAGNISTGGRVTSQRAAPLP